ncbi:MAG: hypothetical protein ACREL3_05955 [Gemmatimonadales bacterium]
MNASVLAGSLLTGLILTAPLSAQQVSADVIVRGGPVAGRVIVDNGYSTYRRPPVAAYRRPEARRVVVVDRYAPRVIVVERVRAHKRVGYWARHGYRPVTLYYTDGRYYDRYVGAHGVREIVVYERNGRFYSPFDGDYR